LVLSSSTDGNSEARTQEKLKSDAGQRESCRGRGKKTSSRRGRLRRDPKTNRGPILPG